MHASCCHSGQTVRGGEEEDKFLQLRIEGSRRRARHRERAMYANQIAKGLVGPIPSHPPSSHPPVSHSASNYPARQSDKCGDCTQEHGKRQRKEKEEGRRRRRRRRKKGACCKSRYHSGPPKKKNKMMMVMMEMNKNSSS